MIITTFEISIEYHLSKKSFYPGLSRILRIYLGKVLGTLPLLEVCKIFYMDNLDLHQVQLQRRKEGRFGVWQRLVLFRTTRILLLIA